jgi:sulfur relay (sulfurtransferase) DsrC/TusE family protein
MGGASQPLLYQDVYINVHINIKVSTNIRNVKYLFKYVYKGPDHVAAMIAGLTNEI